MRNVGIQAAIEKGLDGRERLSRVKSRLVLDRLYDGAVKAALGAYYTMGQDRHFDRLADDLQATDSESFQPGPVLG